MPNYKGKKYSYDAEGMAAYKAAVAKNKKKKKRKTKRA